MPEKKKKKRPEPQYKQLDNIPLEEVSVHLMALSADGYTEWSIYSLPCDEVWLQHPPSRVDGIVKTEIKTSASKIMILAWWDDDEDDE